MYDGGRDREKRIFAHAPATRICRSPSKSRYLCMRDWPLAACLVTDFANITDRDEIADGCHVERVNHYERA